MPTAVDPRTRSASCWTQTYLEAHCEGYRVFGPAGALGYVDAVSRSETGALASLVVATPTPVRFGREDVLDVDHAAEVVWLVRHAPADVAPDA